MRPPESAPISNAARAASDAVADSPRAPARAKPRNTTLPVMLATNTCRARHSSRIDCPRHDQPWGVVHGGLRLRASAVGDRSLMDDESILGRIESLVEEEHALLGREQADA